MFSVYIHQIVVQISYQHNGKLVFIFIFLRIYLIVENTMLRRVSGIDT